MAKIVCLCGSTKFRRAYELANELLTLDDFVVLSVGMFGHGRNPSLTEGEKRRLDILHLEKIQLADCVLFLDVGGYMGESTQREEQFSIANEKPRVYLSVAGLGDVDPNPIRQHLVMVAKQIHDRLMEEMAVVQSTVGGP